MLAGVVLSAQAHADLNPVYRELRETGVAINAAFHQALPAPTMPDGLDADAQAAVIAKVARAYPMTAFLRKSVVAPHVLQMDTVDAGDPKFPGRRVDFWFVAYGDLDAISRKDFLDRLLEAGEEEKSEGDEGRTLTAEELAKRGISVSPANKDFESYGHASYELIQKVRLELTGRAFWSRTPESIVTAVMVDPRFRDDAELPNQWRAVARDEFGAKQLGAPQAYDGAGLYAKITRLARPAGALFVECHVVFSEPYGWFDGNNLLGSKVPPVVQSRVRSARRELMRAAGP
jgi:hypothetical protein